MQTKLYASTLLIYGMTFSTFANANDTVIINGQSQKLMPISSSYEVVPLRVVSLSDIKVSKTREGNDRLELQFSSSASDIEMKTLGDKVLLELGDIEISAAIWSKQLPKSIKLIPKMVDQNGKKHGTKIELNLGKSAKAEGFNVGNKFVLDLIPIRASASAVATGTMTEKKKYSGKNVSFNFQDVPIRTVLQLLSEESGHNIVVSDNVSGNVTLRLLNIPWDQALDIVSQAKGLDYRKNNNVIWVGLQDELARSEQAKEDARIALENKVELQTMYIPVNYHSAVSIYKTLSEDIDKNNSEGKERENSFFSSRGRVVADERTNTLILTDIPSKLKQLKELIDAIDRPVDQVLIEARLVVATDGYARELGSRFGVMGTRSGTNNATIGSSIEGNNGGFRVPNVNLSAGGFTTTTPGAVAYTLLGSNFSLDMELSAMQEQNKGEVISNPRLITSNQREGVIRQGKEIGYVTVTGGEGGSAATPNVQFKEALLELKVTPTITNDNRVFLNLNVKKDEIDQFIDLGNYGAVPQISKREISTAVLIEDGQTLVVGGIYEFTDRQSLAQIPFLGDVPFLGNLFKKKGKSKQKAELLVFITPRTMIMGQRLDPNSVLKQ